MKLKKKAKSLISIIMVLAMAMSLLAGTTFAATDVGGETSDDAIVVGSNGNQANAPRYASYVNESVNGITLEDSVSWHNGLVYYGGTGYDSEGGAYSVSNATITMNTDADGTDTSDFGGLGAAVAAIGDGITLTVENTTIETTGVAKLALYTDDGAVSIVKNSTLISNGGVVYDGYYSTADTTMMVTPPWVLGLGGAADEGVNARTTNIMGTNSVGIYIDSTFKASGWGALSTDNGSGNTMIVINTYVYVENSGYGAYTIGETTEEYYGSTMDVSTYAIIMTGGEATFKSYTAGQEVDVYKLDGGTDEYGNYTEGTLVTTVTSDAVTEGTVYSSIVSDNFGFMCHSNGTTGYNIVNILDGTSVTATDAIFLIKKINAVITVDDATLESTEKGVILQIIDNDDDYIGVDASVSWGTDDDYGHSLGSHMPTFNQTFSEEDGYANEWIADTAAAATEGYNTDDNWTVELNITNTEVEGDIWNSSGYVGSNVATTLTVNLGEGADLTGIISAGAFSHDSKYAEVGDGDWSQASVLGHVTNIVYSNGVNLVDVVLTDDAVWTVSEESYIDTLEISDDAEVIVAEGATLTVASGDYAGTYEAGTVLEAPDELVIVSVSCYNDVTSTGAQSTIYSVTYIYDGVEKTAAAEASAADATAVLTLVVDGAEEEINEGDVYDVYSSFSFVSTDVVDSGGPSSPPWEGLSSDEGSVYYFRQALLVEDGEVVESSSVTELLASSTYDASSISDGTITINGSHFNGIYITGTSIYAISNMKVYATGDGGDDFSGWGAAIMADGNTTVTIDDSYIETAGTIRTAIWVGGSSVTTVTDSVIYAQETEDDYLTYQNLLPAMMKRVPFALGMEGTVRATNVLGSGQGIYSNSIIVSTGWGALSTDSGTSYSQTGTYALDVSDSLAGIGTLYSNDGEGYATEAAAIAAAGSTDNLVVTKEINGVWYALEVTGSGYVTYADAGVMNYYENVEFYSPDYVQILASGLSSSTYEDSYMYSERIAFMTQQAGGGTLTLIDSTVDTTDALLQIKSGAANTGYTDFVINNTTVNFSGDSVRTEAGILVELIESDDAGNPGVTTYTVSDTGADAELTSNSITDSNATFQNGTYTGDIWNSIYNYYQALNVTLEDSANLIGTVSSSVHVHVDPSTGEVIENGTVLDAYTGSEEGDIADYRDSEYGTTGDYLVVGSVLHTANEVINNPINLTIDATSTWTVTGLGYLNSLTVESLDSISAADGEVTIYTAALTVAGEAYADGTYEANGVTIVVAASDAEAEESSYIEGGQTYASIAYGFYAETADGAAASSKVTLETLNYIDGNVYFNVEAAEGYEITDIVVTGGTVEANSGDYEELSSYEYMLVPDGSGDEMTVTFIISEIGSEEEEEEPDENTGEEEEDEYGYTLTADDIEVAVGETAQIVPVLTYGIIAPSVSSNYISESVVLTEDVTYENGLTIAEGVEISADADGYTIVMTVDGVQMDIEDGTTYEGYVVLEYTKYVIDYYESHGSETEQYMTVALSIKTDDDGNQYIDYEESVESALVDCEYDEYGLTGGSITSYGEYFGGVRVSGDAEYTVDGIDITLYGNGGNDFTGIGAAIAICDNAVATVDNSSIYTEGALRSACFAGDYSTLYVNTTSIETHSLWDEYGVSLQEVSIDTAGMTTPPTGLGVYGNNRANNVVDYASAYYTDCDIYADSWGAMGCDDVESAEDEDQFQYFTNCTIYVANSGYGAYSIGYIWDMVDGSDITVENGLGLVAAAEGSVMVYNGSTITSGRIGIVTHQGMGAVSNIVVTEDSSVTAEYTAILVKERASAITISDGATLTSNSGAIIQAVENDDSGAGSLQGDETVTVDIEDTALTGDILQSLADVPMTVTITDATVTGAISTATETYENGGTVETYANVGIISENVLEATDDELIVILEEDALWVVTETSYLDSLEVAATAEIDGVVYVDGEEVDVTNGGTYTGEIVVEPAEDSTDSVPEDLDSDMGVDGEDGDMSGEVGSSSLSASYSDGIVTITVGGSEMDEFDYVITDEDGNTIAEGTISGSSSATADVSGASGTLTITLTGTTQGPWYGETQETTVTVSEELSEAAAGATTSVWDAYIEYLVEYVENNTFNGDSTTEEMVEFVQALTEDSYESEIIYEVLTSIDGDAMTYEEFAETYVAEEEEEDTSDDTADEGTDGELSGEGTSLTYATAEDADGNTVITLSNSNAFEVYSYTITLGEGLALVDGDLEGSVSSSDVTITVSGEGTAVLDFTGTYGDTEAYSETITIGAAADGEETPDDTQAPDDAETPDEGTGTDEESDGEVTYTYVSDDETIATVDDDGVVTGVAAGETTIDITAYVDGEEVAETTINVTVTEETIEEPAEPETEEEEEPVEPETEEEEEESTEPETEEEEEESTEPETEEEEEESTEPETEGEGTEGEGSGSGTEGSGSDTEGSGSDTEGSGSEITGGEEEAEAETEAETEAEAEETESTSAATGDATNTALWMALAALAVLGLALISLKRKFN